MKLGTNVMCNGYLKKQKTKYVVANQQHFDNLEYPHDVVDEFIFLEEEGCHRIQKTMEYVNSKFNGIVIGKKLVSIENLYYQAERHVFDEASWGYIDSEPIDEVVVEKANYIECYHVAFRINGTRLVPADKVVSLDE